MRNRFDKTTALLRTIGDVLYIRSAFSRISAIANHISRHDAFALQLYGPDGDTAVEATSPADLSACGWSPGPDDDVPFSVVGDMRGVSAQCAIAWRRARRRLSPRSTSRIASRWLSWVANPSTTRTFTFNTSPV